jgi:hypothetical protein
MPKCRCEEQRPKLRYGWKPGGRKNIKVKTKQEVRESKAEVEIEIC